MSLGMGEGVVADFHRSFCWSGSLSAYGVMAISTVFNVFLSVTLTHTHRRTNPNIHDLEGVMVRQGKGVELLF